jgi:hypothetical protein
VNTKDDNRIWMFDDSFGDRILALPSGMGPVSADVVLGAERRSDLFDMPARDASALAGLYRREVRKALEGFEAQNAGRVKLGALLLEPVLMGAAGMVGERSSCARRGMKREDWILSIAADDAHQVTWCGIQNLCINSGEGL